MTDYLGSQRLLGYALGQRQRPVAANVAQPTQAKLTAQADWDEVDLQVKSMISMRLSSRTTSMATWTNLDQRYGIPHFTGIYKDYELAHSIKLVTGENPEIRIQKIWTILERLWANGCNLSPYLEGMLLLKAIPKEWDTIAQIYCNGMQMANITFDGVRDAIMAEFERIARPAQLAHQADKISAVKRKGASPCFKEQKKNNSAPHPATDAPHGESSSKRTKKGGKQEKARKAKATHNIVSSAFVPVTVLNRMQESHYTEAGPSTSRVKKIVEPPAPTPVTIVGGPSRAPARSAAPIYTASVRPSGISYSKALTLPMQSVSGSSSKKAPFNMEKERMLLKEVSVQPTAEPLRAMHKLVEEQDEAVDRVLGKHRKFMKFAEKSSPVQNTVASTSMPEKPVEPSLQDSLPPAPAFKSMKEYDEHQRKRRNRTKKAKKAKQDVHPTPVDNTVTTNIQVFPEVSLNPILDMTRCTETFSQTQYDEPLDWGTDSAQDNQSSDEDSVSNEIAATAGISRLSLTPAPTRRSSHAPSSRSSKSKGKQREDRCFGGNDWDNNPDSHAYDDYGYNRLVSTNLTICTLTKDKELQLLSSLSSLESRVELICNKCSSDSSNCVRCKTHKTQDKIEIMADSGASNCFTHTQSDLSEFEVLNDDELVVKTASKTHSLKIKEKGAWIITHEVTHRGKKQTVNSCLYPVYYLPGLTHQLMSVGHLLNDGTLELKGSSSSLDFSARTSSTKQLLLQFKPYCPGQNIYWLSARLTSWHAILAMSSVTTVD
jgi:hypothetical protein